MIKTIIAYVLALFLGPLLGSLIELVFIPLLMPFKNLKILFKLLCVVQAAVGSFAIVYIATLIFGWLSVPTTGWLVVVIAIGVLGNDLNRLVTRRTELEKYFIYGDITGLVNGYVFLIQQQ